MLFSKSINTKAAEPNPLKAISDAINAALSKGVFAATVADHLESCLSGLRQMAHNRSTAAPIAYDLETMKPKNDRAAQRAEERRQAEALRAEQEAYAAAVNERGRRDAIMNHGKTS
jgi:hypothetical protein